VLGQDLFTGPAEPRAVLLEARQHDLVTIIHHGPAMAGNIARAGVVALLLGRGGGRHHKERNEKKKSGHLVVPSCVSMKAIKF
jgi:hypothetical protein